jgi:hypothetical protein
MTNRMFPCRTQGKGILASEPCLRPCEVGPLKRMASVESTDNDIHSEKSYGILFKRFRSIFWFLPRPEVTRCKMQYDGWYVLHEIVSQQNGSQYAVRIRALLWHCVVCSSSQSQNRTAINQPHGPQPSNRFDSVIESMEMRRQPKGVSCHQELRWMDEGKDMQSDPKVFDGE